MRIISDQTQTAWRAAWKGGDDRPMVRATISRLSVASYAYNLAENVYGLEGQGVFTSALFGQQDQPVELPNIKSVKWDRSSRQDAASCTIELWNTDTLPLGGVPEGEDQGDFDRPGYFTFNRGESTLSQSLWNQATNGWQGLLMPDRVIKTYEGYGFDIAATPETDVHLYPSGVWLIDSVDYTAAGTITVTCRDIGRLLLDQLVFPPVVPFNQYPLTFQVHHNVANPKVPVATSGWSRPLYETDSNIPYIGKGFTDGGRPYVSSNGAVLGHLGAHAVDSQPTTTYWLSVGNYPNWSSAYEYVQTRFSSRTLQAVKIRTFGGPYTYYISVYSGGKWQGLHTIPYAPRAVDTNADIRFVKSGRIGKDKELTINLPKAYTGATKMRVTFSDLYDTGIGQFRWRAGIRDIQISSTVQSLASDGTHVEGNYSDYTDIVKLLCAWGGFFWPEPIFITSPHPDHTDNYQILEDGTRVTYPYPSGSTAKDDSLPRGRVWGEFEQTGTQGKVDLGVELFDKKPLMDGINYIREIIAFLFFVNEVGQVVWRSPNIWEIGNLVVSNDGLGATYRTTDMYEIDERETLLGLTAKLSSANVRTKIFVANVNGKYGAMAGGYDPADSKIRRVAGWTDQNFNSEEECQIMADLISIREMFTYRTNQIEIPANPAIQVDDQIRILERTTAETYVHYVDSLSSDFDMLTGRWTYSITTHWLGPDADGKWVFDPADLSPETQAYLKLIGKLPAV